MSTCVYEHPLRRIILSWERDDDGVPVLTAYNDEPITSAPPAEVDIRIVHGSNIHVHRFPADEYSEERQASELTSFLPEVAESDFVVHAIPSVATSYNSKWITLLGLPKTDETQQVSDIEADMRAISLDGTALVLGRRGDHWWVGAVDDGGTPLHLERIQHPEKQPLPMFLHETVNDLLSTTNLKSRRLVIFGDQVTPDVLKDLSKQLAGRVEGIERLNPFHHVRSTLDEQTARGLLRRSHLLGAMVGAINIVS